MVMGEGFSQVDFANHWLVDRSPFLEVHELIHSKIHLLISAGRPEEVDGGERNTKLSHTSRGLSGT